MLCRADSVPEPTITWRKKGSSEVLTYGEQLHIVNANSSDDGSYTCTASNYLGQDTKEVTLNVQSKLNLLFIKYGIKYKAHTNNTYVSFSKTSNSLKCQFYREPHSNLKRSIFS